ncbi:MULTISPECIES: MarR family transcriptional regulator [unclassified Deinococcus]|uniref:MarR family transcriptional regulator n=1 Tax=unclassified Deinococcus TaxID=2623546 RepID=UPI001C3069BA|nr:MULTISPECIES: helix-turn-helix domain-containing protein [unclassified Deinococcus]MDK2012103.1 helix-turn-helix domain-containing protein [Deinococcus sp. 43]
MNRADLLFDPQHRALLALCHEQARSVTELANLSGTKPNTAYRCVQRLLAADLLTVAAVERRAGRSVRRYAPAHATVDVPFRDSPYPSFSAYLHERMNHALQANLERSFARLDLPGLDLHLRVHFGHGVLQVDPVLPGLSVADTYVRVFAAADTVTRWVPLRLTPDELTQLRAELDALTRRYFRPLQSGDTRTGALGLFLLPG